MTNSGVDLEEVAAELLEARHEARLTIPPSGRFPEFDLDRGYEVGHLLHISLTDRGYRPIGRKIGFTNQSMWDQFRVNQPIWAHMYDQTTAFTDEGRVRLSLDGVAAPRLEPEIVLKPRCLIPGGEFSVQDLAACLEWVAIGYEVVDCHYPDWCFTAADAVADFGFHAKMVVGKPWMVEGENPILIADLLSRLRVTLQGGKDLRAEGEGRAALGSPLHSVAHLTKVLATQPWAAPLQPDEVITTGTLTALPYLRRGESYRLEAIGAPLAPLEVELT